MDILMAFTVRCQYSAHLFNCSTVRVHLNFVRDESTENITIVFKGSVQRRFTRKLNFIIMPATFCRFSFQCYLDVMVSLNVFPSECKINAGH